MQKTILIAEDNEDLRMLLAHELMIRGYRVITASNGGQAVSQCMKEKPDLILMDIAMPGKDGTEAAEEIKADLAMSHIPVIFLTALVEGTEVNPGEEATDRIILSKSTKADGLVRCKCPYWG